MYYQQQHHQHHQQQHHQQRRHHQCANTTTDMAIDVVIDDNNIDKRIHTFVHNHIDRVRRDSRFLLYDFIITNVLATCVICEGLDRDPYIPQHHTLKLCVMMCHECAERCSKMLCSIVTPLRNERLYYKLSSLKFKWVLSNDARYCCNCGYVSFGSRERHCRQGAIDLWICSECSQHSMIARYWQRIYWMKMILLPEIVHLILLSICELPCYEISYHPLHF